MRRLWIVLFIFLLSCTHYPYRHPSSSTLPVHADLALKNPDELTKTYDINAVERLQAAKIVYVDYELVRRDFPEVAQLDNPQIDQWLLDNTAFMARSQIEQDTVNTHIPVSPESRIAYRPEDYGRALVFAAESPTEMNSVQPIIKEFLADLSQVVDSGVLIRWDEKKSHLYAQLDKIKMQDQNFYNKATLVLNKLSEVSSNMLSSEQERSFSVGFSELEKMSRTFIGLIDAKGVGAINPRPADHGDGLMTLGEAIREFTYEKMVNRLFIHEGSGLKTVGTYAVIDAGFAVKHPNQSTSQAGIILRQAHARAPGRSSTLSEEQTLRVEKVLRQYGLTSAGAYRQKYDYDLLNVQGTTNGAVIDFGGFLSIDDFKKRDAIHFFGRDVLYSDSDPQRVVVDETIRLPLAQWGSSLSGVDDPKMDNLWIWSHELAQALASGRASRDDAYQHLRNMWGPAFERLDQNPRPTRLHCQDLLELLLR